LKDIKKKLKGKNADEIVEDLLGKGETADSAKAKGKKLLDQFLNKE
jgi:hypothetical protein